MTEGLKQLSDQAEKEHQDEEERKAKASGDKRRGWFHITLNAAFWCARSAMTNWYTDQWAGQFATIVNPEVTHMQWCHAILGDRTFKSPWSACEDAVALAFDLHPDSFVQAYDTIIWMPYGLHHLVLALKRTRNYTCSVCRRCRVLLWV